MSEYISKEEAIDRLCKIELSADQIRMLVYPREAVVRAINDCPSADVRENIHAAWGEDRYGHIFCTACKKTMPTVWKSRICPLCGAIMDGEPKGEKGD